MSAQPIHSVGGPVPAIPRTIDAISRHLPGAKRMAFYAEVGSTAAHDLEEVMERWWTEAMLDQIPGREEQVQAALDGQDLVALDDLAARLGVDLASG